MFDLLGKSYTQYFQWQDLFLHHTRDTVINLMNEVMDGQDP